MWPIKPQIGVDLVYVVDEGLDLRGKNVMIGNRDEDR